ncbi:MAG: EamA family transporter [Spirochaetae bacterium HGW-Spirochaetae-7]|jgi:drug/metabolite transporter (DMT)-like permease|nr:MAG: EamA family transporter [Spirochaetae bacterium HGW-Spirochaetae-7]
MASVALALFTIVIWSSLALLSAGTSRLPPLFAVGAALCVGGLVGVVRVRDWRIPPLTLAVGVGGIFGYHALLFAAFRLAPAVEVNILNYLWPLLIVVLAPVYLRGYRLSARNVAGAMLGLAGAMLVVSGGRMTLVASGLPGYLLAALAAFVWASYSLLSKRLPAFPTGAVGLFCLVSGILSLGLWAAGDLASTGTIALPALTGREAFFLLMLGIGPMGGAFYTWDAALKRGDPRTIGALAYLTPLLSTLNLVAFGGKSLSATSAAAMGLIVAGAIVGTGRKRRTSAA